MRVLVAIGFVALVAASVLQPAPDAVQRGLTALHRDDATGPGLVLAVVAAGEDPHDWHGDDLVADIAIPDAQGIAPLWEAYAVLAAGADPSAYPDPERGVIDLTQMLADNVDVVLAGQDDAAISFQILAMHAAAMPVPDALRERLIAMQDPSGAWGCGPWLGPECTGFALVALSLDGIPDDVRDAAVAYLMDQYRNGPFDDPLNGPGIQVTAWAINGLRAADAPVPGDAWDWLRGQQSSDGWWRVAGRADPWATTEAIVTLSGGHPVA